MANDGDETKTDKGWTDERVSFLKRMWEDGRSAGDISRLLGQEEFSRSAVIGKVHRLCLARRSDVAIAAMRKRKAQAGKMNAMKARAIKAAAARRDAADSKAKVLKDLFAAKKDNPRQEIDKSAFEVSEELNIPIKERKRLVDLESDTCRWPIGDPRDPFPVFHFCGRKPYGPIQYCEFHALKAFQPPMAKTGRPFVMRSKAPQSAAGGQKESRQDETTPDQPRPALAIVEAANE